MIENDKTPKEDSWLPSRSLNCSTARKPRATFRLGCKVRVIGERGTARIVRFLADVEGGVEVEPPIAGLKFWNILELRKTR